MVKQPNAAPRILYIEGHTILRDLFSQLFEYGSNYDITIARHGLEGVEKALAMQPDLILMGLRMPFMNGFEVITVLRTNPITAKTPIIVLSAWADAKSKSRAFEAGADEHITPPVEIRALVKRINWHLKLR